MLVDVIVPLSRTPEYQLGLLMMTWRPRMDASSCHVSNSEQICFFSFPCQSLIGIGAPEVTLDVLLQPRFTVQ